MNPNNIKTFEYSLNNPEPIIDDYYIKSGNLIISKNLKSPTKIMEQNLELLESISAYNFARKNKNNKTINRALNKILEIVKNKSINYSEFVSFWPVVDISYSLFCKMTKQEQLQILKNITD